MEANSEGDYQNTDGNDNSNNNVGNSNEGQSRPKRQMKTPFQLEVLEKAYTLETYPSEAMRAELSQKLGLSDRQLQMWFCHRRLKDKKETPAKKPRKAVPLMESPVEEMRAVGTEPGSDYGSGSGSGSSPFMEPRKASLDDVSMMRRFYESSPQSVMELRAIACVEAQLGEPLREDGPILGMEFDPLPPDAFGAPIVAMVEHQKRSMHSYDGKVYERHDAKSSKASARAFHDFLQDSSIRSDAYGQVAQSPYRDPPVDISRGKTSFVHEDEPLAKVQGARHLSQQDKRGQIFTSLHRDDDYPVHHDFFTNNRISAQSIAHPIAGSENADIFPNAQVFHTDTDLRIGKKRKNDEARIAREVEAHENQIRKELEKQDQLRRKSEERMRKEMERHERERRKEEERLMRERQREEERSLREQKRELERREKFLQKEYLRAEKRRQKEELQREREAVKRQAAIEKATARRIAKESMDLIEDVQLELMELAAASKGQTSIVHLNYETLQNLDSFRDSLRMFPPESVQLKKPFAIQPWIDSEENIGNLLMVWRFVITFADVLGLWPFTLDEFVQAFHDYDSRLLGEVHVALLKLIIKDIEDVARTPSTGLGSNQYCSANPEGGHLLIVEGAYMWGFDIRNWQRHLNPLTWPEIFRQLALSAGFGPRLKKRNSTRTYFGDNDEVKGCENTISTLRNGSAAENAFALMRERGLLLPRRSRHRLTPGTVKFAAFHVLSLEGSKGLTVLELADKIQKSGLRDLTTSKTPEASISVALTRDQKLFERIAPSTYCVRAAYRKDPADGEAILSAARKKIQVFENGFLGGEDADDAERDEDSEGDVDEDPEVDDLAIPLSATRSADKSSEANTCSGSGKNSICNGIPLIEQNEPVKESSSVHLNGPKDAKTLSSVEQRVPHGDVGVRNIDQENIEIDESKSGESWIQGLAEGEYAHLSVEERLNALVALVGLANEGNAIRSVLEDRLEAANALKKQMWAEAQSDRSRLKEDIVSALDFPSSIGGKAEMQVTISAVEGSQSPLPFVDSKNKEASPSTTGDQKPLLASGNVQNHLNSVPTEKTLMVQDLSMNPDNFASQQHGYASKRSRSQLKAYIGHIAEETYVYRSLPLGQDRRRNRYWQFVASASKNDPCSGRIFVELNDGNWRLIDCERAFDALLSSLDTRGIRESHLRIMFQKIEKSFKENVRRNLQSEDIICQNGTTAENEAGEADSSPNCSAGISSPSSMVCGSNLDTLDTFSFFRIELGRNEIEKKGAMKRYQDFQKWMWKECFNSLTLCSMKYGKKRCSQILTTCDWCFDSFLTEDTHCDSCHQTFNAVNKSYNFSEHGVQCKVKRKLNHRICDASLPLGIRLLKALLAFIEVSVPPEGLESFWMENHRKTWATKLNVSLSTEELLQILTVLESAIKRDCLSADFETTKDLLSSSTSAQSALYGSTDLRSVPVLPWIPKTTAAVALRLFELDGSITYIQHEKVEPSEDKPVKVYMLPSRYSLLKSKEVERKRLKQSEHVKGDNVTDLRSKRNSKKCRRGGRDQGYGTKWQRRAPGLKSDANRRNARETEKFNLGSKQGRKTNTQGSSRGRRTVRKRRAEMMVAEEALIGRMTNTVGPKNYGGSLRNLGKEDWGIEKVRMDVDDADNSNSMEAAESDDNVEADEYEQVNWDQSVNGASSRWNRNVLEVSDDDGDASGDDNGIEEMGAEESEGDVEISEGSEGVGNKIENDEGTDTADSDDYISD
ncbi:homeobox-DDT domain protein RLT1 isoform X4 [Hevea brasiliensis]|uniref:homeobox-DDT domain protein RLT1 isoform X4 n=1 Tax=Hevea brasiliensis TaxID=3981 RepID=UPI0025F60549|nr:homeobox-DDT domain protein RLT1 isoform X4 [Hevea brasiliensis]